MNIPLSCKVFRDTQTLREIFQGYIYLYQTTNLKPFLKAWLVVISKVVISKSECLRFNISLYAWYCALSDILHDALYLNEL